MGGKLVSVIIPTYNCSQYIEEAVRSVLGQTFDGIELIIIDDGSTDNTEGVVRKFTSAENIKYYKQSNQGQAAARRKGLSLAKGDYIAFLDADDSWESTKLQIQMELIKHDACDVCFTDINLIDGKGNKIFFDRSDSLTLRRGKITKYLFYDNFIAFSSVIVKKSKLQLVGGNNPAIRRADDWDLLLRLSTFCTFDYIDEKLTNYRISRPGQISSDIEGRFISINNIAEDFINNFPGIISKSDVRRAKAHRYRTVAYSLRKSNPAKAIYYAVLSLSNAPFSSRSFKIVLASIFYAAKHNFLKQSTLKAE